MFIDLDTSEKMYCNKDEIQYRPFKCIVLKGINTDTRLISRSANFLGSADSPPAHSHLLYLLSLDGSFLPFCAVLVSSHCCVF